MGNRRSRERALSIDTDRRAALMLLPATGVGRPPATQPRVVFRPGRGESSAELEVPTEFNGLRLLDIHAAVLVDLKSGGPRLVRNPDAPTLPLPPPRRT